MNVMNFIAWLLPVTFMLHDFEEIIMAEVWNKRNQSKINLVWVKWKPFGLNYIHDFQTPTFSIAVGVEFLGFSLISLFSIVFHGYFLWYGAYIGLILHYVLIHMFLCIRFKGYVPGIVTSAIFLFPSIWILYKAEQILNYSFEKILFACLLGIILTYIFFQVLHRLMGYWSDLLSKYSDVEIKKQNL